jgi:hypothetical protein
MIKNKKNITEDKKNPDRDYMLVKMYKYPHCSTSYGVGGNAWTFFFYQHLNLNSNGFSTSVIDYLFFITKLKIENHKQIIS